jgi:hypothetical protein
MLVSVINRKFLQAYDEFASSYLTPQQKTDLFARASEIYWEKLIGQWGYNSIVNAEITPLVKTFTLVPSSNDILYTDFANGAYNKVGAFTVEYQDALIRTITYYYETDKNSIYSTPSKKYPKFDLTSDRIRIFPRDIVVVEAEGLYLTNPPAIDFVVSDYDVPILDINLTNLIDTALRLQAVTTREDTFFQTSVSQQNIDNAAT